MQNKNKKIRLSEYVIDFIAKQGVKHVFMFAGGGGMYLIDSLGRRKDIKYVCNHHEQACAMSAEGYQRVSGNLGVALVTTGPAATNVLTGLLCSWNDSIPVFIISGQANSKFLIGNTGMRQRAVHEVNITKIVESVTKYAITVMNEQEIKYHLEKALYLCKNGRPGPVWLDIPLDIQSKMIDPKTLISFDPKKEFAKIKKTDNSQKINKIAELIKNSKRPIIVAGHGIKLSNMQDKFINFIEKYNIPVVTTKNAYDLIYYNHPLHVGNLGINGQRVANIAVQNADLVLCLGTRLPFPVVGYATELFAKNAKKIIVDIDEIQLKNSLIASDVSINTDIKDFIPNLTNKLNNIPNTNKWVKLCQNWKKQFPLIEKSKEKDKQYVNSYNFFDILSDKLSPSDVIVTDQGASFYGVTQAFKIKKGQKLFTNGGFSPMGYGLPAAIGACFANNKKRVICVHGDGGLELNIQELQTIVHHKLPIKLFVFNNKGYLSIKHTQTAYFDGFFVGCDAKSGLTCVDILKIAKAYGIPTEKIDNHKQLKQKLNKILSFSGPMIIEVLLDPMQKFEPKVTSEKQADGSLVTKPLDDMYPFLSKKEMDDIKDTVNKIK